MKICRYCLVEKELVLFFKSKTCKDGYRNKCKDCFTQQTKKYYSENREIIISKTREDKLNNKDKYMDYMNNYQMLNKDKLSEYRKNWENNNKEKVKDKYKRFIDSKKDDGKYKLVRSLRSLVYNSIKSRGFVKNERSEYIIGLDFNNFKSYIESKFESWMTWENYGRYNGELNYGWDIDHIIPISSAITEEEVIKLNYYTNLQPLCSYTNRYIKRDSLVNY